MLAVVLSGHIRACACSFYGTNIFIQRTDQRLAISSIFSSAACDDRRQRRWDAAVQTLESTTAARRKQDHRAHLARLIGVYVGEPIPGLSDEAELLLAMQPDQGGRKLLFLSPDDGRTLGFIELETLSTGHGGALTKVAHADDGVTTSVLRGMLVCDGNRGKGYARLFLSIWLGLCMRAGVTPATSRINKPLLALTLVRLGFTPVRGRTQPGLRGKPGKSRKANQRPLAVEVSKGQDGNVLLYCSTAPLLNRLEAGFSATELTSQRLVVAREPPHPRGRVAHIRVRYAPPGQTYSHSHAAAQSSAQGDEEPTRTAQVVHAPLAEAAIGGRLRLSASQGPSSGPLTDTSRVQVLRVLTGALERDAPPSVTRVQATAGRAVGVTMSAAAMNATANATSPTSRSGPCKARALASLGGPGAPRPPASPSKRGVSDLFRPDSLGGGRSGVEGTKW